jgi:hypothetical protein
MASLFAIRFHRTIFFKKLGPGEDIPILDFVFGHNKPRAAGSLKEALSFSGYLIIVRSIFG